MTPDIIAHIAFTTCGLLGVIDQNGPVMIGSAVGLAGLQVWTLTLLGPVRAEIANLRTEVRVLRQRLNDAGIGHAGETQNE